MLTRIRFHLAEIIAPRGSIVVLDDKRRHLLYGVKPDGYYGGTR